MVGARGIILYWLGRREPLLQIYPSPVHPVDESFEYDIDTCIGSGQTLTDRISLLVRSQSDSNSTRLVYHRRQSANRSTVHRAWLILIKDCTFLQPLNICNYINVKYLCRPGCNGCQIQTQETAKMNRKQTSTAVRSLWELVLSACLQLVFRL